MADATLHGVNDPSRSLADQVLAYLVQHPQAQDTMEGVVEWWLLEQGIHYGIGEVEAALSDLVQTDYLVARQCRDGRTYYGLNRAKEREIRMHLDSAPSAHEPERESQA
jgi:hypothetical protein